MSEKPESDEFEEKGAEDVAPGGDEVDVDHILRDVESQRRRAPKGAEPAWRRLERVMEERRTAELLSDFDDYEVGESDTADADEEESRDLNAESDADADLDAHKAPRRKKGH